MTEKQGQTLDYWVDAMVFEANARVKQFIDAGTDPMGIDVGREGDLPLSPMVVSVSGKPRIRVSVVLKKNAEGGRTAELQVEEHA